MKKLRYFLYFDSDGIESLYKQLDNAIQKRENRNKYSFSGKTTGEIKIKNVLLGFLKGGILFDGHKKRSG